MILSDKRIREELFNTGRIKHAEIRQLNPASFNLCLGSDFAVPKRKWMGVALGDPVEYDQVFLEKYRRPVFKLRPGQFVLATTKEWVDIPDNLSAFVQGRSSIGRAGLSVQNAGFVDPGFRGHITLELKNETKNTIILKPGYPVTQLVFMDTSDVERPYAGKYLDQMHATGSRMDQDPDCYK